MVRLPGGFAMRLGMCTEVEHFAEAAEAGYAFVEPPVRALVPHLDDDAFVPIRDAFLTAPIKAEAFNCFLPAELKVTGPAVDEAALERYMRTALRRVAEVGGSIVVFGSGGARRAPQGWPLAQARVQFADAARRAADIAAEHGVTIVLEPLTTDQCNHFNRVDEGAAIVDAANHRHLKLLVDLRHFTVAGEPLTNIVAAGPRLVHVHVDPPQLPGYAQGGHYDYAAFFAALRQAGYNGSVSVEDHSGLFWCAPPPYGERYRGVSDFLQPYL